MPAHDRVRLHDDQGRAPISPRLGEEHPKQSISRAEWRTADCTPKDGQLLTQCQVLERDGPVSATDQPERSEQYDNRSQHALSCRAIDLRINRRSWRSGSGEAQAVSIPEGFLPVRVIDAVKHEPVPRAFVTWTIDGGGRAEATTTVVGDALLEGVGTRPGILTATAPGFQPGEERLEEPPGIPRDIALTPQPAKRLPVLVVTASGDPLPNVVVEVAPANPLEPPQLAVTDAKGMVTFPDAPASALRVTAIASGYVASTMRISQDNRTGAVLSLSPGYRAVVIVELPAISGPLFVRVLDTAGRSVDTLLDAASDRSTQSPGRLSLGPLPPGDYAIELRGAREQRQDLIKIVDRNVVATFR
jgi:hypothetical protein